MLLLCERGAAELSGGGVGKLAFKSTSSNFALPKKLLGALPAGQGRRNRLTHT